MKKILIGIFLAVALVVPLSGVATAMMVPMTNGSFETGDFTGWTINSYDGPAPAIQTIFESSGSEIFYSATHGDNFALLTASSSISQNTSWNTGDQLSFDWAFSAQDYMPYNDYAWFDPGDGSGVIMLSDIAAVGDYGETPWANYTHTYESPGSGDPTWGPNNSGDSSADSVLLLDNVGGGDDDGDSDSQYEPVPEPTTVALLGIGLVGLAGAEVRRRRKNKAVDNS